MENLTTEQIVRWFRQIIADPQITKIIDFKLNDDKSKGTITFELKQQLPMDPLPLEND